MRLARLDLLRYGRFTDASIELPQGERDLHIVLGLNEAGKTTSLTAIEDLLFGIPERSPYNFLHSYDSMRIGAVLENGDNRFEFQRRKTRRDMILGPGGDPLPGDEGLLAPFLGGADRAYFDRMFNLSHGRLAEGGKAIIEAKDDVGQMLFSAGTGLADLRERLKQLEEEADRLWGPRRSERRLYHQAEARLEDARSRQREHSLSANAWRAARKALSDAEKAHVERRHEHEATSIELKKLARIRRVHAAVRRRGELEQGTAALGDVIVLAEDAGPQLAEAEKQEAEIKAQVEVLAPELEKARQALEGLALDDALVWRADDITQLNEQRIEARRGRSDLPKRRDEYHHELEELAKLAAEISWDIADPAELIERVPPRGKLEPVRLLLAQDRELATVMQSTRTALEEALAALEEKTELLDEMGEASDVSGLAAVLNAARDSGDVAGRIRMAQGRVDEASEQIERKVRALKPFLPDDADIEALAVPLRETVVAHRDDARDWRERLRDTMQRLADARNALERDQKALERRVRDEGVVAPGTVEDARSYRDILWELVKVRYVEGSEIPAEEAQAYADALEDLPASFEGAVQQADSVTDRRFDKAQAAGELAVLARNIAEQKDLIGQLEAEEAALKGEGERLDQAWQAMWADVPIEVSAPDAMLVWLDTHNNIVTLIGRQREAQRQLTDSRSEEKEAIALVQAELTKLGWDAEEIKADALRVMVEKAERFRRDQEAKAERLDAMQEAVRTAKADLSRRRAESEKAQVDRGTWRTKWAAAVAELGLQGEDKSDVVSVQINVIDQMREHSATAKDLRDKRIATIERDIAAFERVVAEVVAELAPDLVDTDADAAVVQLERRRDEALELHKRQKELTESVTNRQKQIDELDEGRKKSGAIMQLLKEAAGVKDVDELRAAIERSDRLRTSKQELAGVVETLGQQGDGLAIDVLEEECRDIDIDEVRGREEVAEGELKVLSEQLEETLVARTEARKEFDAIAGDDAAAKAAADREEALAAMQGAAESYVRARASGLLLRWAIDRYRKEKQGPLLKRAGELFRVLTRNSFKKLDVAFDERENLHLTGVRPNGEVVAVPGLSSGTEDQLFLALRLAAVEDYLERAVALPFVADDLFINFDPERSAAGFEVLGQLAERTQVLFYTHHPHLIEVAVDVLGPGTHVVSLEDAQ